MSSIKDNSDLMGKIKRIVSSNKRMSIATSVDSNPSVSSVFYAYDDDLNFYFFSFLPTQKVQQISYNPKVTITIDDPEQQAIKGLQIQGRAQILKDPKEIAHAKTMILEVAPFFEQYFDLVVARFIKIVPTQIKFIDFQVKEQFEIVEFPENHPSTVSNFLGSVFRRSLLWFRVLRAPFFTASIVPVTLGILIAWNATNIIDWGKAALTLLAALFIHGGTNMANDYFDHVSRNDEKNKFASYHPFLPPLNGGSRAIQAGLFSPTKVITSSIIAFLAGIMIALYLNSTIPGDLLPLFLVIGVFLGLFYTARPLQIAYRGLGEISVGIGFGPLFVISAYYINTGGKTDFMVPLVASIPVAILITMVLLINEFQDVPADSSVGKNTLVVRLGKVSSLKLYQGAIFSAYASVAIGIIFGFLPIYTALAFLTVPLAIKAVKLARENFNRIFELLPANLSTINLHLSFGLLLSLGFFIDFFL